jgi:hypothetical protein
LHISLVHCTFFAMDIRDLLNDPTQNQAHQTGASRNNQDRPRSTTIPRDVRIAPEYRSEDNEKLRQRVRARSIAFRSYPDRNTVIKSLKDFDAANLNYDHQKETQDMDREHRRRNSLYNKKKKPQLQKLAQERGLRFRNDNGKSFLLDLLIEDDAAQSSTRQNEPQPTAASRGTQGAGQPGPMEGEQKTRYIPKQKEPQQVGALRGSQDAEQPIYDYENMDIEQLEAIAHDCDLKGNLSVLSKEDLIGWIRKHDARHPVQNEAQQRSASRSTRDGRQPESSEGQHQIRVSRGTKGKQAPKPEPMGGQQQSEASRATLHQRQLELQPMEVQQQTSNANTAVDYSSMKKPELNKLASQRGFTGVFQHGPGVSLKTMIVMWLRGFDAGLINPGVPSLSDYDSMTNTHLKDLAFKRGVTGVLQPGIPTPALIKWHKGYDTAQRNSSLDHSRSTTVLVDLTGEEEADIDRGAEEEAAAILNSIQEREAQEATTASERITQECADPSAAGSQQQAPEDHPKRMTPIELKQLVTQPSIARIFEPGTHTPAIIQWLNGFGQGNPILNHYESMSVMELMKHATNRSIDSALKWGLNKRNIMTAIQERDAQEMVAAVWDMNLNLTVEDEADIEPEDDEEAVGIITQFRDWQDQEVASASQRQTTKERPETLAATNHQRATRGGSMTLTDRLDDENPSGFRHMDSRQADNSWRQKPSEIFGSQEWRPGGGIVFPIARLRYTPNPPSLPGPTRIFDAEEKRYKFQTTFPKYPMLYTPERDGEGYYYKDQSRHRRGAIAVPPPIPPIPTFDKSVNDWKKEAPPPNFPPPSPKPAPAGLASSQWACPGAHQPGPSSENKRKERPETGSSPCDSFKRVRIDPLPINTQADPDDPSWEPPSPKSAPAAPQVQSKEQEERKDFGRASLRAINTFTWDHPSPNSGPAPQQVQNKEQEGRKDSGRGSLGAITGMRGLLDLFHCIMLNFTNISFVLVAAVLRVAKLNLAVAYSAHRQLQHNQPHLVDSSGSLKLNNRNRRRNHSKLEVFLAEPHQ